MNVLKLQLCEKIIQNLILSKMFDLLSSLACKTYRIVVNSILRFSNRTWRYQRCILFEAKSFRRIREKKQTMKKRALYVHNFHSFKLSLSIKPKISVV